MAILCVGIPEDTQLYYFLEYLNEVKADYYFLNQRDLESDISLSNRGIKKRNSLLYEYADFSGVYNRMAVFSARYPESDGYYLHKKAYYVLHMALESECRNVVNPLRAGISNDSKPYQLCFSNKCSESFYIPPSQLVLNTNVITIEPPLIYKSTSSVRSVVSSVEKKEILGRKINSPLFVQQEIIGNDIRAHVVGNKLFCTKVESSEVDYRYNLDAEYKAYLPNEKISKDCLSIAKKLNLPLAGIDIIESEDDYYFLEANPSPGFYFYEQRLKERKISEALLALLVS